MRDRLGTMSKENMGPHHQPAPLPVKKEHNTTQQSEVPDKIYDSNIKRTYTRGRFLGKGGFARCYEVIDPVTKVTMACKVVNKSLLAKPHQREKMAQEITIHRGLKHEYVVDFHSYFEDDQNVYIMLELCGKKSLMELQKRRRIISETEAKYFLKQIVLAVLYLHEKEHIIHRDLKLGNIFITDGMELKVGDFGLATRIEYEGERKKTLCGTPNYIAPEVLSKRGHSYQVDIWSIGCIVYTLLIGKPPFETNTLRDTYHKIRRGDYYIPSAKVGPDCKDLLTRMLQVEPALRPDARAILNHPFLTKGDIPSMLPASCLTMAPRFEKNPSASALATGVKSSVTAPKSKQPLVETQTTNKGGAVVPRNRALGAGPSTPAFDQDGMGDLVSMDVLGLMINLRNQLRAIVDRVPRPPKPLNDDDAEDPALCPMLWICKWVDYSDKYGFGYQLSDDSIGVSFNDQTKLILLPNMIQMHYIDKEGKESYHTLDNFPSELVKKVKLLNYFQQYMKENLLKASGGKSTAELGCIARLPNLWTWFRTSRAVVMVLSNGTLQINNFRDHSKMILCPLLGAISTLGMNKNLRTYKLAAMTDGLTETMMGNLRYALEKLDVIIGNPKNQPRPKMISSPMKKISAK